MSEAFTNSIIPYNRPGYNLFTDNKNVITNDIHQMDKIRMVIHWDNHRRRLYLNLHKQDLMVCAMSTVEILDTVDV